MANEWQSIQLAVLLNNQSSAVKNFGLGCVKTRKCLVVFLRKFSYTCFMATETSLIINDTAVNQTQAISARELLLLYFKQNGYKLVKEDAASIHERKDDLLIVSKQGRKELIDIKGISAFFTTPERKEEQLTITDHLLHTIQSTAEALFFSFINFGKYFKGEKITSALALPDTERYRQIIEKLQDYFTENNLDFKIYLLGENGEVKERNLNQLKDGAVPKEVMEKRKALGKQT
jgi:hypothetical protein